MRDTPILLGHYPRAIAHMDADAFFAAVEQALEPSLQGKPVVTGKERGIIACANYQAKALGIKRGIPLFKAKQMCPELVILPNDYETYSLYSKRMFAIMRRYTPIVEEYSVDEAFLDLTGVRGLYHASYDEIARRIQADIHRELNITVSVGLSCSKALAKLCSKFRKPNGFTAVPGIYIHHLLRRTPLESVWGIGPNTAALLRKHGLATAHDFVLKPDHWVKHLLHKPGIELWHELRGDPVWKVDPDAKSTYATILKSKTFTPPSADPELVFAMLVRNVEAALAKARRYKLRPRALGLVLRHHDFRHDGLEARLNRPTAATLEVMPLIRRLFDQTFRPGSRYRSTMIVLGQLESDEIDQYELFQDPLRTESLRRLSGSIDRLNGRFGRHTVTSGTALFMARKPKVARDDEPERRAHRVAGEHGPRRIGIPRLTIKV